ncbi:HNH endonuclease [Halorubrum sp. FL23]|uniref:HNH endonuclease n=1 Tax=Halorubrum sp. FL23 TaxID=3458704 RepID=UPI0040341310
MEIEPAGQPIDFLDHEIPDYIELEIGVDSGPFTMDDLVPEQRRDEEDTNLEGEEKSEKSTNPSTKDTDESTKSENTDPSEGTDKTTNSTGQDPSKTASPDEDPSLEQLRNQAKEAAVEEISEDTSVARSDATEYTRSSAVRDYVKARAGGSCEGCKESAPFVSKTGDPYFHAHHVHELSDGGSDMPSTVIALCPNCHYRVHHGKNGNEYNEQLREKLLEIEPQ